MTQDYSKSAVGPILKRFSDEKSASPSKWLLPLREAGMAAFAGMGFPTLHHEDWRFTNLLPIEKLPFLPARQIESNGVEDKLMGKAAFTTLPGNRLVFVNGFFSAKLS